MHLQRVMLQQSRVSAPRSMQRRTSRRSVLRITRPHLNRVKRIVKVLGMVNSDPTFTAQPRVINGASDLLVQVFGDCGKHARSAVGVSSLIFDIAVEIEMIVELR